MTTAKRRTPRPPGPITASFELIEREFFRAGEELAGDEPDDFADLEPTGPVRRSGKLGSWLARRRAAALGGPPPPRERNAVGSPAPWPPAPVRAGAMAAAGALTAAADAATVRVERIEASVVAAPTACVHRVSLTRPDDAAANGALTASVPRLRPQLWPGLGFGLVAVGVAVAAVLALAVEGGSQRQSAEREGRGAGASGAPPASVVSVGALGAAAAPVAAPVGAVSPRESPRAPRPRVTPGAARRARADYRAGERFVRGGQWLAAAARLEAAVGSDPALAEAHRSLGGVYRRLGQHARAVEEFRAYLALRPDAPDANAIRALLGQR
jgi:hypothetical protein